MLLLFGDLAVSLIYQRREFSADSTSLVAAVLGAYSLGLVAMSCMKLFASGFHALQDTATPMRIAAISVTTGILISVGLTLTMRQAGYGPYSAVGLALGGACGAWLNLLLHWWLLSRRIGRLFDAAALRSVLRLGVAVIAAAGASTLVRKLLEQRLSGGSFFASLVLLLAVLGGGGVIYLLIAGKPPRMKLDDLNDTD